MYHLDQLVGDFELEMLLQLFLSVLLGGLVGLERETRGRAAGLRTMVIVCLGSTLIMIVSARLPLPFDGEAERAIIRVDPGRVAAGIVTGVGFLGAGVVLKLGNIVRGVTTAASIWFVAGLGIAIGQKHYVLALVTALCGLVVLWLVSYLDKVLPSHRYTALTIEASSDRAEGVLAGVEQVLADNRIRLMDIDMDIDNNAKRTRFSLSIRTRRQHQSPTVMIQIAALDGVQTAGWS